MRAVWQKFWQSSAAGRLGAWANAPPLPWTKFPVWVDGMRLCAPSFDRWAYLWAWKLARPDAFILQILESFCAPGDVAADLGANVGLYSLALSRRVGSAGRVLSFEPEPKNFACLESNLKAGGADNARPHCLAIGESTGHSWLHVCAANRGDHRVRSGEAKPDRGSWEKPRDVEVTALDDFLRASPRLDVVKLDIQGNEGCALRGMRGLLEANPGLRGVLEFWPKGLRESGDDPTTVLAGLAGMGYRLWELDESAKKPIPLHDIEALARKLGPAGYAHIAFAGKSAGVFK